MGSGRIGNMDILLLKLILTPALIAAASLAGRRWGPAISGWLVGLPLTSAPVAFFLALAHGTAFAAAAALGILAGTISQVAFCLTYGWLAPRFGWPLTVAAGSLVFAASTAALQRLDTSALPLFLAVVATLLVALRVMPGDIDAAIPKTNSNPGWDIPTRMIVATAYVLLVTAVAPALGPQLTGLVAPFPLYATILAVFANQLEGAASATRVLRGLLLGLFAFAGFFLALAILIEPAGIALAFVTAVVVALTIQAGSLWVLRRTDGSP